MVWAGPRADLPGPYDRLPPTDLGGRLVTPGLIDCHTHIVFGGDRAAEFEMRLNGASYEEVARAGGGILSTVTATRAASEAELLASALARADQIIAGGATTIEVKSGYGLTVADELKMLRVARQIGHASPGAGADHPSCRPCRSARIQGPRRRLYRRGRHPLAARRPCRGAGRCGGCLLRRHRLFARAGRAAVHCCPSAWACPSNCMPNNCPT